MVVSKGQRGVAFLLGGGQRSVAFLLEGGGVAHTVWATRRGTAQCGVSLPSTSGVPSEDSVREDLRVHH